MIHVICGVESSLWCSDDADMLLWHLWFVSDSMWEIGGSGIMGTLGNISLGILGMAGISAKRYTLG